MKRNQISWVFAGILLAGILSGCGEQKETSLVNTLSFNAEDFQSFRLDYDADDIYVLASDNGKVIVKEYMNEDKKSYYAGTSTRNDELLITEGDRPRHSGFESYVELYIPQSYADSLSLHSTSGTIHSEIALNLSGDFSADTTSGVVELSNAKASNIYITSTNGDLRLEKMDADKINIQTTNAATAVNQANGVISYQSKGGKLTASDLCGSGSFHASGDGSIDLTFADVTGDISAYSKNGTLSVTIPQELAFKFSAVTKEGSIDVSFGDQLGLTEHTAAGTVGASPEITIELETRNGDIKVSR